MHRSMTWWIRAFLISSALRGLLLGVNGLLDYRAISIPLQFTPLNAAFVAALYLAGTIGLILTLFARDRADARPFLIGTAVVTTLLLTVTGLHWSEFETTLSPKLIGWVGSYVFDPVAITLLVTTHGLGSAASPGRHRLTPLFLAEAGVLGMLGLVHAGPAPGGSGAVAMGHPTAAGAAVQLLLHRLRGDRGTRGARQSAGRDTKLHDHVAGVDGRRVAGVAAVPGALHARPGAVDLVWCAAAGRRGLWCRTGRAHTHPAAHGQSATQRIRNCVTQHKASLSDAP